MRSGMSVLAIVLKGLNVGRILVFVIVISSTFLAGVSEENQVRVFAGGSNVAISARSGTLYKAASVFEFCIASTAEVSFGLADWLPSTPTATYPNYDYVVSIRMPWWVAALILAVPEIALLAKRRQRRIVPDVRSSCESCGYDLRATPEQCPECGSKPPVARNEKTKGTLLIAKNE
jgi:predicted RNA-binding Zn-ribbon protein involved in translation (DUF1610 family)